VQEPALIQ